MRSLSGPGRMAWPLPLPSRSQGRKVLVFEASDAIGGACLSAEFTLPGFVHDVCSAMHPFAVASPFFKSLPLSTPWARMGDASVMLAHPLDNEPSGCLYGSVEKTAEELRDDGAAYRRLFTPLVDSWPSRLGPRAASVATRPICACSLRLAGVQPASTIAVRVFARDGARALLGGVAAHAPASRTADRAFRARLSRPRHCPLGEATRRYRARQSQLRRRRHCRECNDHRTALHPSDVADVLDAGARTVHLLGVDAAWCRSSRDVRLLRRAASASGGAS